MKIWYALICGFVLGVIFMALIITVRDRELYKTMTEVSIESINKS